MASLDSVEYKVFRAAEHIKGFGTELERYFKSNPGHMVREPNTPDDQVIFTFQPKGPIPARFGLIIGDCLQNLRSSLDYLVWELVLATNNQPGKHNMFPICDSAEAFKDALNKRKRLLGVNPEAIAEIEALQPYHLGEDFGKAILWVLDELTNINKHRRVLVTELRTGKNTNPPIEKDGELWLQTGPGPTPVFDSNAKFGPFPIMDGKVKMDAQLVAVITFGEGGAKGMEVTLCLNEWSIYILQKILPRFKRFF
jgi:hypothetical protein